MEKIKVAPFMLMWEAEEHFGNVPNVASAIDYLRHENSRLIYQELREFDTVITLLNEAACKPPSPEFGGNVRLLHQMIGKSPVPRLRDLIRNTEEGNGGSPHDTLVEIQRKIVNGEWEFPYTVGDAAQLAAGLLIEGYGLDMDRRYIDCGDVGRQFVLAFEEILCNQLRYSSLKSAVLPWMVDERENFSPYVRRELDLLACVPRTLDEQVAAMPSDDELECAAANLTQALRLGFGRESYFRFCSVMGRHKQRERIKEKIAKKKQEDSTGPLTNLIGARIILPEGKIIAASNTIGTCFGWWQPSIIWGGVIADRDFSIHGKNPANEASDPECRARHKNIIYEDPHGNYHIVEIQLMTSKGYELYLSTRPGYEQRRKKRR